MAERRVHGQVTLEMEQIFETTEAGQRAWERCFRALLLGLGADPAHLDQIDLRLAGATALGAANRN